MKKIFNILFCFLKSLNLTTRIIFIVWTFCSFIVIASKNHTFIQKVIIITFGYLIYCGFANVVDFKKSKDNFNIPTSVSKKKRAELEERWRLQDIEKQKRIEQCNSFKIQDMYQFVNIPFEWQYVSSLSHTNGKAWFMLNINNQYVAFNYIDILDKLIFEFRECNSNLKEFEIFMEEIDFMYSLPFHPNCMPNTYIECIPYTKTGKKSKYPVILHFASSLMVDNIQTHPYIGEIKIMQDGNIGNATVTFIKNYTKFTFGLHGINLIIKRIDDINGNIYKFED